MKNLKLEQASKRKKYDARYWCDQLTQSEERHRKFRESAKESINIYRGDLNLSNFNDVIRKKNVWWYLVNTILPAYYSSTPKVEASLRKKVGGLQYQLAATILERNVQYCIDEHFDFPLVGYNAALSYLLTGRGVLWARYEANIEEKEEDFAVIRDPNTGMLVDQNGEPFELDEEQQFTETEYGGIVRQIYEDKDDEKAILEVVQFNDYFTSDGRNESEIEWRSRRAFLSREEATEIFGSDVAKKLKYDSFPETVRKSQLRSPDKIDGKAELHEVWCEASEKVYWVQKRGDKTIIEEGEAPIEFEDFYPCSVINTSVDPDSTIPVSDFVHCKDMILEVERLTTRIASVTQAIRSNGLYDASLGPQIEGLLSGDLKMIPVTNWPSYKTRGGLSNGVEMMQINEYINALQVLIEARKEAENQLYEVTKASDLLRGVSDPSKTATANRLENAWSSLGLIVRQNQFAEFISKGMQKLGTIIAEKFDPQHILTVADADTLIAPLLSEQMPDPEPIKQEIIRVLQDDDERCYRIAVTSDSLVALDERQERQDAAELMQTAGSFFQQMDSLVEKYPPLLGFCMQLQSYTMKFYKGGKELDGIFQKALADISGILQQRAEAASQQPPDPKVMESQTRLQIAQQDEQLKQMLAEMEMQNTQQRAYVEMQDAQAKAMREAADIEFKQWLAGQELGLKQQDLALKGEAIKIDMQKVMADAGYKQSEQELKREIARVDQMLQLQQNKMKEQENQQRITEALMEERRLAADSAMQRMEMLKKEIATEKPQAPNITIQMPSPKPSKKVVKFNMDDQGGIVGADLQDLIDEVK